MRKHVSFPQVGGVSPMRFRKCQIAIRRGLLFGKQMSKRARSIPNLF
jgi:hypothetical protein